jgi:flagellin
MSNGVLSDTPPTYYAQADGSITTTEDAAAGKLVYKGSDGKLTTDTTSKAESTSDPLAAHARNQRHGHHTHQCLTSQMC